jgi:hypothetical protein
MSLLERVAKSIWEKVSGRQQNRSRKHLHVVIERQTRPSLRERTSTSQKMVSYTHNTQQQQQKRSWTIHSDQSLHKFTILHPTAKPPPHPQNNVSDTVFTLGSTGSGAEHAGFRCGRVVACITATEIDFRGHLRPRDDGGRSSARAIHGPERDEFPSFSFTSLNVGEDGIHPSEGGWGRGGLGRVAGRQSGDARSPCSRPCSRGRGELGECRKTEGVLDPVS